MTDNRKTIAMLRTLKAQAVESHNDTAVLEVKIDSFNFVLDKAITALKQEPCEDCISRQAVVDTTLNSKSSFKNDFACGFFIDEIRELPTVTPQEKSECERDHEVVKAYHDGQAFILDRIVNDIQSLRGCSCGCSDGIIDDVEDIIDKYKAGDTDGNICDNDCEHCDWATCPKEEGEDT